MQIALELCALADQGLHLRIKKAQPIATLRLDLVHGDVCLPEQLGGGLLGGAKQRGANAASTVVHVRPQGVGLVQAVQQLFAHALRLRCGFVTVA